MVLSDPPGGAQTVKKQTLFALCGIHDFLCFSVFSVSEKYFYAKTQNFLKKSEFHRKKSKIAPSGQMAKSVCFFNVPELDFHPFS